MTHRNRNRRHILTLMVIYGPAYLMVVSSCQSPITVQLYHARCKSDSRDPKKMLKLVRDETTKRVSCARIIFKNHTVQTITFQRMPYCFCTFMMCMNGSVDEVH